MSKSALCVARTLVLLLAAVGVLRGEPRASDTVRNDWYCRESLAAVRDWETILAWWERQPLKDRRTPVFPVPQTGEATTWPVPVPRTLLPEEDRAARLDLRLTGGRIELTRGRPGRTVERQLIQPGETVLGYKHPGGGGSDQWYHRYHRRFDRLTMFRPRTAPFALAFTGPPDLLPGVNELHLSLRGAADRPVAVVVRLRLLTPKRGSAGVTEHLCSRKELTLTAGATQSLALPVTLASPGGGFLILDLEAAGVSYWLPLFTYVEDVPALLTGIDRLLTDEPDESARTRLAALHRQAGNATLPAGMAWRALFEEASALRDELLLRRIDFARLLFVKRKPFYSEQPFMDAHHCYNRPGGGVYDLSPVRPDGKVTAVADSLGSGIYRDLCLHWNADRLLFSFGNGSDRVRHTTGNALEKPDGKGDYDLYEVAVDGTRLRQLTSGPKNDCEPAYLPGGQICFTSDRSEHYVMCGSDIHVANLFVMNGDGSGIRQLSHNVFNEFNPAVLPDGRVLYTRWEYNERSVTSLHKLFTIRPDGSHPTPFYGNATIRPNVTQYARPVPSSHKVTALFTAHHGQTHGPIGLIDPFRGLDGAAPITRLTPGVPVSGEKVDDSDHGWFSDPVPLSETTYLCSFTPTVLPWLEKSWALYVGDWHGNLALVYRDPHISCAEPVPVVRRRAPDRVAPVAAETGEATLLVLDLTRGLPGVSRDEVRALRILEDMPRKGVCEGGVIVTAGTSIYTAKRILGTVPVEPDGSVYFTVPADRNLYFQVVDARQREVQRMRSVVCLKPGESRTCVGCHESPRTAPPNLLVQAVRRRPSRPTPPPWGTRPVSFLRDVQPVLNDKCASCHTHGRATNRVILTDDLTDQFTVGYEELLPYLSVANAMRWDHPDDVYARPPYTYGSKASRLTKLLEAGHHGVSLTEDERLRLVNWIDANAVYYDRYESAYQYRRIFGDAVRKTAGDIYRRRCASCHGAEQLKNDGRGGTWWLSLNRHDVTRSRALQAPLARAAGGWGRCDGPVFASTDDPDYQALRQALTGVRDALAQRPREDLLSLRPGEGERRHVVPPVPIPSASDSPRRGTPR
jgi:hypothetical protein